MLVVEKRSALNNVIQATRKSACAGWAALERMNLAILNIGPAVDVFA